MRSSVAHRRYDDIILVDCDARCIGAVRVGDVIHGIAQMTPESTAAPLRDVVA